MTPTKWKPPKTGEQQLRVTFRGTDKPEISKWTYRARDIRWSDKGEYFDVIAWEYA